MSRQALAKLFLFFYFLILLIPGYTVLSNTGELSRFWLPTVSWKEISYFFFRLSGLYAFVLIFIQIMLGSWMPYWKKVFGDKIFVFHNTQGLVTYGLILFHPLLFIINNFLITASFDPFYIFFINSANLREFYISFGRIALVLLTIGVFSAYFRHKPFLNRHFRKFHILNYIAFWLIFVHSLNVGSDTRTPPLIWLYPAMAILVSISIAYRLVPESIYRKIHRLRGKPSAA